MLCAQTTYTTWFWILIQKVVEQWCCLRLEIVCLADQKPPQAPNTNIYHQHIPKEDQSHNVRMHSSLLYNLHQPSPLRPVSSAQACGHDDGDLPNHGNRIPHPAFSLPNWVGLSPKNVCMDSAFTPGENATSMFMQEREQCFFRLELRSVMLQECWKPGMMGRV